MRTQSLDTSPAFERIQIAHTRTFSAARKFASTRSWTQSITSANFHASSSFSDIVAQRDQANTFVTREYGETFASLFLATIQQQSEWSLQAPDIQAALLPLLDITEQLDIPALLLGSLASSIYGFPHVVQTIDILVDFSREHLSFLLESLARSYIFDSNAVHGALYQHTSFSLLHITRLIKIEVFLPSTTFDKVVLERRQAQILIEERAPLSIASVEDVTLLHLIQYQARGSNADDMWNDILGMLKVQAPTLDTAYLEEQAKRLGIEELLAQALIDAGIRDDSILSR